MPTYLPIMLIEDNIARYPLKESSSYTHLALGDLQGNFLLLIYILLRENIIELNKNDYRILHFLCGFDLKKLSKKNINIIVGLIQQIKVLNKNVLVHLMCDRGNDDYIMLKLYEHLHRQELHFNILISEYSAAFIEEFESNIRQTGDAIQRDLIDSVYYAHLKLLDYSVSKTKDEIRVFSNAPIGFETIKAIAQKLCLPFSTHSIRSLTNVIDAINDIYHRMLLTYHFSINFSIDTLDTINIHEPLPLDDPILRLIWNRAIGEEYQHCSPGEYTIEFIHGHGPENSFALDDESNIYNLYHFFRKTSGEKHNTDIGAHCKILQLDDRLYYDFQSDYMLFIHAADKINQLIAQKPEEAEFNLLLSELIEQCRLSLLAHLDEKAIAHKLIKIINHTSDVLSNTTDKKITSYLKTISDTASRDNFSYKTQINLSIKKIARYLAEHQKEIIINSTAKTLSKSMPVISEPTERAFQPITFIVNAYKISLL